MCFRRAKETGLIPGFCLNHCRISNVSVGWHCNTEWRQGSYDGGEMVCLQGAHSGNFKIDFVHHLLLQCRVSRNVWSAFQMLVSIGFVEVYMPT